MSCAHLKTAALAHPPRRLLRPLQRLLHPLLHLLVRLLRLRLAIHRPRRRPPLSVRARARRARHPRRPRRPPLRIRYGAASRKSSG